MPERPDHRETLDQLVLMDLRAHEDLAVLPVLLEELDQRE